METIDIVKLAEVCVKGRGKCSICPYGKENRIDCVERLLEDVINHIKTLQEQIEYYEEVIEEYETAELKKQELSKCLAPTLSITYDVAKGTCSCISGYDIGSLDITSSSSIGEVESALDKPLESLEVEPKRKIRWLGE